MAVANPYLQNEWDEWKRGMEDSRRKRWTERVNRWADYEGGETDDMEEESEDEADNIESRKMEEGKSERKDEESDEEEEEGEGLLERRLQHYEKRDEEEDVENMETDKRDGERDVTDSEEMRCGGEEEVKRADGFKEGEEYLGDDGEQEEEDEEDEGESGINREVEGDSQKEVEQNREGNHVHEDDDEEEEEEVHQTEEPNGSYDQDQDFNGKINGIQAENIEPNQESRAQEDVKDEEDTAESIYCENADTESNNEKSKRNENGLFEASSTQDSNEDEDGSDLVSNDEEPDTECGPAQEEFHCDHEKNPEDCTDDEEAQSSGAEDEDYDDEGKVYINDDYPTNVFLSLREFRDSSLLTDLTLNTDDGMSFCVHSVVLAAVSSRIRKNLRRSRVEDGQTGEGKNPDTADGARDWSMSLGPEVDHVGLQAIVEFAYTGNISCLNGDKIDQIKVAAETLEAKRVLDLCAKEEELHTNSAAHKNEEGISAAKQMMISLQSIEQLWMERAGCDVMLKALGASLHVHRVILAVSSDYFRGMFTLGMKESRQPCVNLPFLSASELEVLIGSSYSGALPLSWVSVFEITSTALQLQYQPALSLCLNFLQQEINPHTCLDVVSFAEAYEMAHLLEVADDFVLRQFQKVACTPKFKDLPARQLLRYLNSHSLCVQSELIVFKAVVAWIQAKPHIRLKLTNELMKSVHFSLMTFKEFKEVQSQNMWSNRSLAEVYEAVLEEFCSNETELQDQCRIYLPKESLVLTGGDQISEDLCSRSISSDVWFGNSLRNHTGIKKAMEWRRLGEMPGPVRFCHEVAVLNGQLYVFGGKKYYGIDDTLNSVYRYDPLQNSWECLREMQKRRCSFSVVVLEGKMYAIGGHCESEHMDSVECYSPATNSWSFTWPLDLPLSGHVAKVLQGKILVSGGRNGDYLCLSAMFMYHPETGSTYLANMTKPRAHHCMEILGERLYVAGGITTDDDVAVIDQLACEVYSPAVDSWAAFTSLPVPHVGAGSAVLEGKFYILGGYSQEDYSDTQTVHRYDNATEKWENMGKMPGPNNDLRASLLWLPQHFRM